LLELNLKSKVGNLRCYCQGGEIGRRARLRIPKLSLSKHRFAFQKAVIYERKTATFGEIMQFANGE